MEVENLIFNVKRTGDVAGNSMQGLAKSLQTVRKSSGGASKSMQSLLGTIGRMAKMMMLRQTIRGIIKALDEGVKNAYMFSKAIGGDLAAALDLLATKNYTMSNQIGAAWATMLQTIQPILLKIIELVRRAAEILTQFFALLGGKRTYLKAIDYSKSWAETTAKGASSAKEWKNQLMGFDEINRLEEPSDSGSGSGQALPDYSQMFEDIPINPKLLDLVDMLKAHLADLELFASGALLGLGLILTLTGANVPLGLGLIAAGAYGLATTLSENWDYLTGNVTRTMSTISLVAFGAMFGVGAILALSGANPGLGIALMAAGALGLANVAALNWEEMPKKVKKVIHDIDLILGVSLLGIGAILTFTNVNVPLGIAMMAAGAASLVAAASLNEGKIVETIRKTLSEILLLVGTSLLALGLVLLLFPAAWPIAGGLIAAGLMSIGTSMMLDASPIIRLINDVVAAVQTLFQWAKTATQQLNEMFKAKANMSVEESNHLLYDNYGGGYATGGFPDEGELFMAREGNAPELVGRIGSRTAVANNDQIISGIRQGVYEAVSQAMQNMPDRETVLKVDGETLGKTVTRYQRMQAISANL